MKNLHPSNDNTQINDNISMFHLLNSNNNIFNSTNLHYKDKHINQPKLNPSFIYLLLSSLVLLIYAIIIFIINIISSSSKQYEIIISIILLILSLAILIVVICIKMSYFTIPIIIVSTAILIIFSMVNMMTNSHLYIIIKDKNEYKIIDFIFAGIDIIAKSILGLFIPFNLIGIIIGNSISFIFSIIIHCSTMNINHEYKEKIAVIALYGTLICVQSVYSYFLTKDKKLIYYLKVNSDLLDNANIGLLTLSINEDNNNVKEKRNNFEQEGDERNKEGSLYTIKYKNDFFDRNKKYFNKNDKMIVEDILEHCIFDYSSNTTTAINNETHILMINNNTNNNTVARCEGNTVSNYDSNKNYDHIDLSSSHRRKLINIKTFLTIIQHKKDMFQSFNKIGYASLISNHHYTNDIANESLIVEVLIRISENYVEFLLNDISGRKYNEKLTQINWDIDNYIQEANIALPLINEEIRHLKIAMKEEHNQKIIIERFDLIAFISNYSLHLFNQIENIIKNNKRNKVKEIYEEMPLATFILYVSYIINWFTKNRQWTTFTLRQFDIVSNDAIYANISLIIQVIISLVNYLTLNVSKQSFDLITINLIVTKEVEEDKNYIKFLFEVIYGNSCNNNSNSNRNKKNKSTLSYLEDNCRLEIIDKAYYSFISEMTKQIGCKLKQNNKGYFFLCENRKNESQNIIHLHTITNNFQMPQQQQHQQQNQKNSSCIESTVRILDKCNTIKTGHNIHIEPEPHHYNKFNTTMGQYYNQLPPRKKTKSLPIILPKYLINFNLTSINIQSKDSFRRKTSQTNVNPNGSVCDIELIDNCTSVIEAKIAKDSKENIASPNKMLNESPEISSFPTAITKKSKLDSSINPINTKVLIISQMSLPLKNDTELRNVSIIHEKNGLQGLKSLLDPIYDIIIIDENTQIISLEGLIRIIEFIKVNKLLQGFDYDIMSKMTMFVKNIQSSKIHIRNPLINFQQGTLTIDAIKNIIFVHQKSFAFPKYLIPSAQIN